MAIGCWQMQKQTNNAARLLNFHGPSFGHRLAHGLAERRVCKLALPRMSRMQQHRVVSLHSRLALTQIRVRRGYRQVGIVTRSAQALISGVTLMVAQIPICIMIGTSLPRRQ